MLTSTFLILALSVGSPTMGHNSPNEVTPFVPTYESPPYFPSRSQLNERGQPVVVVTGPGGREVERRWARFVEPDGCLFEVQAVFDFQTGDTSLRHKVLRFRW